MRMCWIVKPACTYPAAMSQPEPNAALVIRFRADREKPGIGSPEKPGDAVSGGPANPPLQLTPRGRSSVAA